MSLEVYLGVIIQKRNIGDDLKSKLDDDDLDFTGPLKLISHPDIDDYILAIDIYNDSFNGLRSNVVPLTESEFPSWESFLNSWDKFEYKDYILDNFTPDVKDYKLYIVTRE